MNGFPFLTGKGSNAAVVLFRSASLFLAVVIACHLLPFSFVPDDFVLSGTQDETSFSFEPLQVCDDGSDLMSFLADHPWVTSPDSPPLFATDRGCCPPPPEREFAEGVPSGVYRPPRTILS